MNAEELNSRLTATPFVPFRLYLTDGRVVSVTHHDFAWMLGERRLTIGYPSAGRIVDREERIALLHIVSVEEIA